MKNPLTLAGIEPAIFRFISQHLNHCAISVPIVYTLCVFIMSPVLKVPKVKVQKQTRQRVIRIMMNATNRDPCHLFKKLKILPLKARYIFSPFIINTRRSSDVQTLTTNYTYITHRHYLPRSTAATPRHKKNPQSQLQRLNVFKETRKIHAF